MNRRDRYAEHSRQMQELAERLARIQPEPVTRSKRHWTFETYRYADRVADLWPVRLERSADHKGGNRWSKVWQFSWGSWVLVVETWRD